jgi:hypothetical protein
LLNGELRFQARPFVILPVEVIMVLAGILKVGVLQDLQDHET